MGEEEEEVMMAVAMSLRGGGRAVDVATRGGADDKWHCHRYGG